jgi:hypothetical protein
MTNPSTFLNYYLLFYIAIIVVESRIDHDTIDALLMRIDL